MRLGYCGIIGNTKRVANLMNGYIPFCKEDMNSTKRVSIFISVLLVWLASLYIATQWGISLEHNKTEKDQIIVETRKSLAVCEDALMRRTGYEAGFMKGEFLRTQEMVAWVAQSLEEAKKDIEKHC